MKHFKLVRTAALAVALGFVGLGAVDYATHIAPVAAQEETATSESESSKDEVWKAYGAHWQVGDSWTVETNYSEHENAIARSRMSVTSPVQWKFTVEPMKNVGDREFYRVSAKCVTKTVVKSPEIMLSVDKATGQLACVEATLKLDDNRTINLKEKYRINKEKGGKMPITSITALPLEIFIFQPEQFLSKTANVEKHAELIVVEQGSLDDEDGFNYEKDVDNNEIMRFGKPVVASVKPLGTSKSIGGQNYDDLYQTTLENNVIRVEQLWAPNVPWPVESDNGLVHSTLIKYEPKEN